MKKALLIVLMIAVVLSGAFAATGNDTGATAWQKLLANIQKYMFEIIGIVVLLATIGGLVWWYLHRQNDATGFKGIIIGLVIVVVLIVLYFAFIPQIKAAVGTTGADGLSKNIESFTAGLSGAEIDPMFVMEGIL